MEATCREPPDFGTVNALFDSEHEFVSRVEMFEGGSRRGGSGYRQWRHDTAEVTDYTSRVEQVREIDDERVLAIMPTSFRFKRSGVPLAEQRFACLVTLRNGKIVRTEVHGSEEEAMQATG